MYLSTQEVLSKSYTKFDEETALFAEQLGAIDFQDTALKVEQYINACFGGFAMLPADDSKKNEVDLT